MQISRQPTEGNYANRSAWYKNINSTQNKFDELTDMIKTRKAHIAIVSETEIDSTYPNDQFSLPGYLLYRNDRRKVGGGILVLISTSVLRSYQPGRDNRQDKHDNNWHLQTT